MAAVSCEGSNGSPEAVGQRGSGLTRHASDPYHDAQPVVCSLVASLGYAMSSHSQAALT